MIELLELQPQLQVISTRKELTSLDPLIRDQTAQKITKKPFKQKRENDSSHKNQFSMFQSNQKEDISEENNLFLETQLSKIKRYSRVLDNSSQLSKIPQRQQQLISNVKVKHVVEKAIENDKIQQIEIIKNPKKTQQTKKIYDYYASKNERKNKILAKAKQFGRNNFYRFLKGGSILQYNKHIHRFHFQQIPLQVNFFNDNKKPSNLGDQIVTPLIKSFQPKQSHKSLKRTNLQLPRLTEKIYSKENARMKTQSFTQAKSLNLINEAGFNKQGKLKRKHIMRSLTEINEKIKRNRKQIRSNFAVSSQTPNEKSNEQSCFERWKYKSLFQTDEEHNFTQLMDKKHKNSSTKVKKQQCNSGKDQRQERISKENHKAKQKLRQLKKKRNEILIHEIMKNEVLIGSKSPKFTIKE